MVSKKIHASDNVWMHHENLSGALVSTVWWRGMMRVRRPLGILSALELGARANRWVGLTENVWPRLHAADKRSWRHTSFYAGGSSTDDACGEKNAPSSFRDRGSPRVAGAGCGVFGMRLGQLPSRLGRDRSPAADHRRLRDPARLGADHRVCRRHVSYRSLIGHPHPHERAGPGAVVARPESRSRTSPWRVLCAIRPGCGRPDPHGPGSIGGSIGGHPRISGT